MTIDRSGVSRAAVLTSLAVLATGRVVRAQQLDVLKVGGPTAESMKAVYYAQRSGLFRRYGLDVQITLMSSGSAGLAAVAGGSLDLSQANLLSACQARDRGLNFLIVAPTDLYRSQSPQALLLVKKDSTIRTGADLNGKVIGSSSIGDLNANVTLAWIDQHGGDSKSVRVIEVTNSLIAPALEEGRIAAASVTAPYKDLAIQSGVARALAKAYDAIAPEFEITGYLATAENIAAKHDAMRRFALEMHESSRYTNTHPNDVVELIASYTGITPDDIRKTARTVDPDYAEPRYIQPFLDFAAKYHMIPHPFQAAELISDVAVKR